MDFVIADVSKTHKNSCRLGHIKWTTDGREQDTPMLMYSTKSGSIPHITRDIYDIMSEDVPTLQISLFTIEHMIDALAVFGGTNVSAYFAYPGSPLFLTIRDPCECSPSGYNDKDSVPLFTRRGKIPVDAEKYMKLVEIVHPVIYQGLSDADTDADSSNKRVVKSLARTCKFMDYCYKAQCTSDKLRQCALFAPIVGGYCSIARMESIRHTQTQEKSSFKGYILEGFHKNGTSAMIVDVQKLLPIVSECTEHLDVDKPKYMPGAYLPLVQLQLIAHGIDIFDTSLAYCAAKQHHALYFDYDLSKPPMEKPRLYIDLKENAYIKDFQPFRKDCECHACKIHTRAYVNHLYKTKELLGPILLMIHNLHHLMEFYAQIRYCIKRNMLPDLTELVSLAK